MNKASDKLATLAYLVQVTVKEAEYLASTAGRLQAQKIDLSWAQSLESDNSRSEMLDAFVMRYGRLQDTLGDKLLRALLIASLEDAGTQLDNLLRAEKLGWIESTQAWVELRALRNRLTHEYVDSAEDLLDALQQALQGVAMLLETQHRLASAARRILG